MGALVEVLECTIKWTKTAITIWHVLLSGASGAMALCRDLVGFIWNMLKIPSVAGSKLRKCRFAHHCGEPSCGRSFATRSP